MMILSFVVTLSSLSLQFASGDCVGVYVNTSPKNNVSSHWDSLTLKQRVRAMGGMRAYVIDTYGMGIDSVDWDAIAVQHDDGRVSTVWEVYGRIDNFVRKAIKSGSYNGKTRFDTVIRYSMYKDISDSRAKGIIRAKATYGDKGFYDTVADMVCIYLSRKGIVNVGNSLRQSQNGMLNGMWHKLSEAEKALAKAKRAEALAMGAKLQGRKLTKEESKNIVRTHDGQYETRYYIPRMGKLHTDKEANSLGVANPVEAIGWEQVTRATYNKLPDGSPRPDKLPDGSRARLAVKPLPKTVSGACAAGGMGEATDNETVDNDWMRFDAEAIVKKLDSLPDNEKEVMMQYARGYSMEQIARNIGKGSDSKYVWRIVHKFIANNAEQEANA